MHILASLFKFNLSIQITVGWTLQITAILEARKSCTDQLKKKQLKLCSLLSNTVRRLKKREDQLSHSIEY